MTQSVHISIDDVSLLFLDLISNTQHHKSIFQFPLLKFLHNIHQKFNAEFTLFGYPIIHNHSLSEITDKFKDEFKTNASWLKFGFHWIDDEMYPGMRDGKSIEITDKMIIDACNDFYNGVVGFSSSDNISKYIRLHYYYTSKTLFNKLIAIPGLKDEVTFLCADCKGRMSYDLTEIENEKLIRERILIKNQRTYIPTDIRIEDFRGDLSPFFQYQCLVVFTHEWAIFNTKRNMGLKEHIYTKFFNYKNRKRLKCIIKEFAKRNSQFIS